MEPSPQALPGDAVDWTEADYHATIGQLYAHISLQQKQINVLRQVRDEYVGMIAAAQEENKQLQELIRALRPMKDGSLATGDAAYAARFDTGDELAGGLMRIEQAGKSGDGALETAKSALTSPASEQKQP